MLLISFKGEEVGGGGSSVMTTFHRFELSTIQLTSTKGVYYYFFSNAVHQLRQVLRYNLIKPKMLKDIIIIDIEENCMPIISYT